MVLISIILPTYNGARTIRQAIESVRNQTFKDFELIIVNDGSTDATGALITEIAAIDSRIRILRFERNQGIQKALTEGLLQSQGAYIARIDADDAWNDPKKLAKQMEYLQAHPDCVLVGTGAIVQNAHGDELYRFLNPGTDAEIRAELLYRNCFTHSSVLFKKSAAMQFNGYDESERVRHIEDYDLWLKLGTVGTLANLPEYCVRFTSDPKTISGANKLQQLKQQLRLVAPYANRYPRALQARVKGYLRLALYALFNAITPSWVKTKVIAWYKRS